MYSMETGGVLTVIFSSIRGIYKWAINSSLTMNDAWYHSIILYTVHVADYSGMVTRIQVFTKLCVCGHS